MRHAVFQRPDRAIGLVLVLPLLLAWQSAQTLPVLADAGASHAVLHKPVSQLVLWGPLLETALLILAARVVSRAIASRKAGISTQRNPRRTLVACSTIIGMSFVGSHLAQNGEAALASLPMGLLLSAYVAHAAQQPAKSVLIQHGPRLFAMHAVYNAAVLALGGA
jgi:hypothetical protein